MLHHQRTTAYSIFQISIFFEILNVTIRSVFANLVTYMFLIIICEHLLCDFLVTTWFAYNNSNVSTLD